MGNGASVEASLLKTSPAKKAFDFFYNKECIAALRVLSEHEEERTAFAAYVKEGAWLDDISANKNFKIESRTRRASFIVAATTCLPADSNFRLLDSFIVPTKAFESIKSNLIKLAEAEDVEVSSVKTSLQPVSERSMYSHSGRSSLDSTKTTNLESGSTGFGGSAWKPIRRKSHETHESGDFHDDYIDLDNNTTNTGFTKIQLLSMLFRILFPLFIKNKTIFSGGSSKESNKFCFMDQYGRCQCRIPCSEQNITTSEGYRAQELLLAAAAYYDEDCMLRILTTTTWYKQIPIAIEFSPLGIIICDINNSTSSTTATTNTTTSTTGAGNITTTSNISLSYPIIYSNTTTNKITGYTKEFLLNKPLNTLYGSNTEPEQIQRIEQAISKQHEIKIAITNYRKNNESFLNMTIIRPIYANTTTNSTTNTTSSSSNSRLSYLLVVFYDLSSSTSNIHELKQIDSIMALLPLILPTKRDN